MLKRIRNRGFTLVELMIVVAIIGVLAALAIYGVRKYLLNAKTAEAKEGIGRIAKDGSAAFDREAMPGSVLPLGSSAEVSHQLCESSASVPSTSGSIAGQKYQSNPLEWNSSGWACLKFNMKDPQYYQYTYTADPATGGGDFTNSFEAFANGDLNGDGALSTFVLRAEIQGATGEGKVVTISPNYSENEPEE